MPTKKNLKDGMKRKATEDLDITNSKKGKYESASETPTEFETYNFDEKDPDRYENFLETLLEKFDSQGFEYSTDADKSIELFTEDIRIPEEMKECRSLKSFVEYLLGEIPKSQKTPKLTTKIFETIETGVEGLQSKLTLIQTPYDLDPNTKYNFWYNDIEKEGTLLMEVCLNFPNIENNQKVLNGLLNNKNVNIYIKDDEGFDAIDLLLINNIDLKWTPDIILRGKFVTIPKNLPNSSIVNYRKNYCNSLLSIFDQLKSSSLKDKDIYINIIKRSRYCGDVNKKKSSDGAKRKSR